MLQRCMYCRITDDLMKCKRVGCLNLLCPDHIKNHGGNCSGCWESGNMLLRWRPLGEPRRSTAHAGGDTSSTSRSEDPRVAIALSLKE
jgi:hypothetical protein